MLENEAVLRSASLPVNDLESQFLEDLPYNLITVTSQL